MQTTIQGVNLTEKNQVKGTEYVCPLRHLLGKKSWNVYNADNIAKVKRDEAAAAAREEVEEQRMQEADAERRIQQLRGIHVDLLSAPAEEDLEHKPRKRDEPGRERKRRRIAGEDDTDRDIRFAREDNALVPAKADLQLKSQKNNDALITDHKGHINLFPIENSRRNAPKNTEVEAEKAKKQKEFEDQYTLRFSNAAGFKQAIGEKPWYHTPTAAVASNTTDKDLDMPSSSSKDVWGNEDSRRKERDRMRIAADDPLAAIKKGVSGVRDARRERKKWKEEKEWEIREMKEAERRERKKRKRRREREEDGLEGFELDGRLGDENNSKGHRRRGSREDASTHAHRHRSRSRERTGHRSHHHHRRVLKEEMRPAWEVGPGGRYSTQFAQA